MTKYLIKVNNKMYHSYKELCDDLDIDYKEFMKLKLNNPDIWEMELLAHFFSEVYMSVDDGHYSVDINSRK